MSDQKNILNIKCRQEFRHWLAENSSVETECWIHAERGKPTDDDHLWYLDAIEETLCYGWIDSTAGKIDSISYQRFSPRRRNSPWTELNKERVRRLEKLGLMTDAGRKVLPPMGARSFKFDPDVELALKQACVWTKFPFLPYLYQRIRAYNVAFYKGRYPEMYERGLRHLIEETKNGKMYGEWNDYGRLLDY